ncbi:MAG TPA: MFS transporter, partial [Erythrobacter sp.]|nr:MFS transporter [Erythrobacter sp.]
MDHALVSLLAASLAFVGMHFALSHPLRAPMARKLGENGFRALYSLVALATFVWAARAFR